MMEEWITIMLKAFFCGWAALGFGILFNVPKKNLVHAWTGGAIVGLVKFTILHFTPPSIILATFLASLVLGFYTIVIAYNRQEPQLIFAIPCIIPSFVQIEN